MLAQMSNSPTTPSSTPAPNTESSEPESNRCYICREMIENRTTALDCNHAFCYECIQQWLQPRSRAPYGYIRKQCPQCLRNIRRIRHQVVVVGQSGQMVTLEALVTPALDPRAFWLEGGYPTTVYAPVDSSLYLIEPVQIGGSLLYRVEQLMPGGLTIIFTHLVPRVLFVLPDDLTVVTAALQARGITEVEPESHGNNTALRIP